MWFEYKQFIVNSIYTTLFLETLTQIVFLLSTASKYNTTTNIFLQTTHYFSHSELIN